MGKKNKMIIGVVVIIIVSILFLIFRYVPFGERAKFVGTWYQPGKTWAMTFNSDGSCSDKGWPGTWEIRDRELIITTMDGASTARWSYSFSDNGRELILSGRGTWIKWG